MKTELEQELWRRVKGGEAARDVIGDMTNRGVIASPKQAHRTLEKWCRAGRWDHGVTLDLGWTVGDEPVWPSAERGAS